MFRREDPGHDDCGDRVGGEQRDAEDQVQPDRGTDKLRETGGRRHDLGLLDCMAIRITRTNW
jgi:hypothetical protein